jgi:hypothetical protein
VRNARGDPVMMVGNSACAHSVSRNNDPGVVMMGRAAVCGMG